MLFNFCFSFIYKWVLLENFFKDFFLRYPSSVELVFVFYYFYYFLFCAYRLGWICLFWSSRYFSLSIVKIQIGWIFSIYLHIFRWYRIVCSPPSFYIKKRFSIRSIIFVFWKLSTYSFSGEILFFFISNYIYKFYIKRETERVQNKMADWYITWDVIII